jgi:hypothetical protein
MTDDLQGYDATMVKAFKESHPKELEELLTSCVRQKKKQLTMSRTLAPKHTAHAVHA